MQERFRIQKLHIKNYKGIDELDLSFPEPLMEDDPDITVLGSRNGVGKTSVLECIAMLTKAYSGELLKDESEQGGSVLAVAETSSAEGVFSGEKGKLTVQAHLQRVEVPLKGAEQSPNNEHSFYQTASQVMGRSPEPVRGDKLFFIHGFRKIREGRIGMGNLVSGTASSLSLFKLMLLRLLLSKVGLFDVPSSGNYSSLQLLEDLLGEYAGVRLGKLRPLRDDSFEIMLVDKKDSGITFPIDGLSSGQKEIISMLFMIYEATKDHPHIVLIDEPELHLNMEWHKPFMRALVRIAPHNQYIIATHSEMIMDSVEPENRIILKK